MSETTTAVMRLVGWVLAPLLAAAVLAVPVQAAGDGADPGADAMMYLARHGGSNGDGVGTRGGNGMGQSDDRERLRSFDPIDQRLREMDRLRDRIHQAPPGAERERLMQEYRERIQQGRQGLDRMPGPGANMSEAERLRYMEERQRRMDRMMEHMWQYQEEQQRAE